MSKVKPIKFDKNRLKNVTIEGSTEEREWRDQTGNLIGVFPIAYSYTMTFPDGEPGFQWIKMHKGRLLKVDKER